jgi:hypothetical protein
MDLWDVKLLAILHLVSLVSVSAEDLEELKNDLGQYFNG